MVKGGREVRGQGHPLTECAGRWPCCRGGVIRTGPRWTASPTVLRTGPESTSAAPKTPQACKAPPQNRTVASGENGRASPRKLRQ